MDQIRKAGGGSTFVTAGRTRIQRRLRLVSKANTELLCCLLESPAPLASPTWPELQVGAETISLLHHNPHQAVKAVQDMGELYGCECHEGYIAGLCCICSRCNPKFGQLKSTTDEWKLQFAFQPEMPRSCK